MKITKELKSVIERQIQRKRSDERKIMMDARDAQAEAVNKILAESEEFAALKAAAEAWEARVQKEIEANEGTIGRRSYPSYNRRNRKGSVWNLAEELENSDIMDAVYALYETETDKYERMSDAILLKLSYEKDFEKAQEILAEYGIELG